VRHDNKLDLARLVRECTGVVVDPASMFDVMVKRIHEYKRQHLAVLYVIALYHRIKCDPDADIVPRTFIFGGKAAPGYEQAKRMIRFITGVADVVNRDPQVRDRLKVVFLPNFNVTYGQRIYPAADLSEQISLAGKEASGTGNMKFAMNGALIIGTMDGANIELREAVGAENFFHFGLSVSEVHSLRETGYDPAALYRSNAELRAVVDLVQQGFFSHGDAGLFHPLFDEHLRHDPYCLLADFASYVDCQQRVCADFRKPANWQRMSVLSCARSGQFSSDRAIREYAERIWKVEAVPVRLLHRASGAPGHAEARAHGSRKAGS